MPLSVSISPPSTECLADFTDATLVVPELRERDMAGVIKELTHVLHARGWVPDILPFYNAALIREYLSSTATESGLAFPHARLGTDDRLQFALGRSPQPVAWGAPRTTLVQFVFVVVSPVTDTARYLHLLSGLARLGRSESLLTALRQTVRVEEMLSILRQVPMGIPVPARRKEDGFWRP